MDLKKPKIQTVVLYAQAGLRGVDLRTRPGRPGHATAGAVAVRLRNQPRAGHGYGGQRVGQPGLLDRVPQFGRDTHHRSLVRTPAVLAQTLRTAHPPLGSAPRTPAFGARRVLRRRRAAVARDPVASHGRRHGSVELQLRPQVLLHSV